MRIDPGARAGLGGRAKEDPGAFLARSLVTIGCELGLYRAMAHSQPMSAAQLALETRTSDRCCREWLVAQAAAGYVEYDVDTQRYVLPREHAVALVPLSQRA